MDKLKNLLDTEDYSSSFTKEEKEQGKVSCLLGYFFILFFLPLLIKNNKYCKYHANQSLNLLLFSLAGGVVIKLLSLFFDALSLNIISLILKVLFSLIIVLIFVLVLMIVTNNIAKVFHLIWIIRIIKLNI